MVYYPFQCALLWKELSEQRIIQNSNSRFLKTSKHYLQMVYNNLHSLVYKKVSICQWKICILQQFQVSRLRGWVQFLSEDRTVQAIAR